MGGGDPPKREAVHVGQRQRVVRRRACDGSRSVSSRECKDGQLSPLATALASSLSQERDRCRGVVGVQGCGGVENYVEGGLGSGGAGPAIWWIWRELC